MLKIYYILCSYTYRTKIKIYYYINWYSSHSKKKYFVYIFFNYWLFLIEFLIY